jgi:hypothetical protein
MEITGSRGVDVALDCTAGAGTFPVLLGIEALKRKGGTIVVQGEMGDFPNFPLGRVTVKFITIKSARGHSFRASGASRGRIPRTVQPRIRRFRHDRCTLGSRRLAPMPKSGRPGPRPGIAARRRR